MKRIQHSLLWVAVALQAGCFSTGSSAPQPYPVPDASVFASLNCEELAYKRDSYQQLLRNVATDHPTDAHFYIPMYQANTQGLNNAIALRNCSAPASAPVPVPAPAPASAAPANGESYCFAYYQSRDLTQPARTTTGYLSQAWQGGPLASAPARTTLGEFQAYLVSRGHSEQLGPLSCSTVAQNEACSASQTDGSSFSHGSRVASVMCTASRESLDKGWNSIRSSGPLLQVIDWRPSQRSTPLAATPSVQAAPGAPTTTLAMAPVATPPAKPADALYCTALVSTQHTYGASLSPVKLIPGAATDIQSSLKAYIAKVKQAQPGAWGEFKLNAAACSPGAVVCMAEAEGPGGKTQNAFQFCHATQAQAEAQLAQMREGDPQAVVVEWP